MTTTLPPSLDLIRRAIDAATAYTIARMRVLEQIQGNPIGIAIRTDGNVTALMAQHLPVPPFNSVVGLRQGQADRIRPLVEWYRAHGLSGRFAIAAGEDDPALGRELAGLGYLPTGSHATLIREPAPDLAVPDAIELEEVASAARMELFLTAYVNGWGIPAAAQDQFKANVRPWLGQPGWSLYLASAEGRPAAAALLFSHAGVGYLADSATEPAFRGRGLHAALLRRRIRDASAAGVAFVCSGAGFLSTSHRNMERAGMRLLFLHTTWTSPV